MAAPFSRRGKFLLPPFGGLDLPSHAMPRSRNHVLHPIGRRRIMRRGQRPPRSVLVDAAVGGGSGAARSAVSRRKVRGHRPSGARHGGLRPGTRRGARSFRLWEDDPPEPARRNRPANAGRIEVNGSNLVDLSDAELVRYRLQRVGFIFQFFNLVPTLTAEENVELPMR